MTKPQDLKPGQWFTGYGKLKTKCTGEVELAGDRVLIPITNALGENGTLSMHQSVDYLQIVEPPTGILLFQEPIITQNKDKDRGTL